MSAHERERLAAWIDGELSPAEQAAVETHVAECEECAALLADLEAVDGVARELPLEVPTGYFESFPARVRSRIETLGPRKGASRGSWRSPAWTWAVAAALLLGVVTPLTIARLGRDGAPEATRVVGAETKDPRARRPLAPAATASLERSEMETEGPSKRAEAVAPPADAEAEALAPAPALGELKKELRPDADNAEGVSGGSRISSAEGFATAPDSERSAARPAGGTPVGRAPAARDAVHSPPAQEADARLEDSAFEGGGVSVDEVLPEAEPLRPQAARAAVAPPEEAAPLESRAETTVPLAVPPAKGRQRVKADTGGAPEDARAFSRLTGNDPVGAAAWRERREAWVRFIEEHADSPYVDDARVRVVEAGIMAWRADGDPADLARARADAEAYLARDDARQKGRVRGDLERIRER